MTAADAKVRMGQNMWEMLADSFTLTARANGAFTDSEKARVWAGFLASAVGAMACDLGQEKARVVLTGVSNAMDVALPPSDT